jgi:acyl-coenzyme A thioesterase PaaI-like protein
MDEIASWTIFAKKHVAGMTTKLEVKFLKPVFVSGGELTVRARISNSKRNLVIVQTDIYDSQGDKVSEGLIYYFTFTPEQAREKLNLPGVEDFYRS